MRKSGLFIIAFSILVLASCEYRTCPTYTKKPAKFEELEKIEKKKQDQLKADTERV